MNTKTIPAMVLLGALASACGPDVDPVSYLDNLRVLAVAADPVELGPDDSIVLRPFVYLPEGQELTSQSWTFCPFSLGPTAAYACAVPACEVPLAPEADGSVMANPGQLALSCAADLLETGDVPPGLPAEIPERVDVYFRYLVTSDEGTERDTVLPVGVWTRGPPPEPNGPPVINSFELDGTALSAGELSDPVAVDADVAIRVRIDPDSLDPYTDESGRTLVEDAIVSFFATAGRFEFDREDGTDVTVTWTAEELEPGQTRADVFAVARDLRGGVAVFGPVGIPIIQ